MHFFTSRFAAIESFCLGRAHRLIRHAASSILTISLCSVAAHAVIVRGHVTDVLGKPVTGARVRLFENGKSISLAIADEYGFYEVRSADAGRFTVVGAAGGFLPSIGKDFYGGTTDVVEQQVVLSATTVRQDITVTASGFATPLPQLTAPLNVIPSDDLFTSIGLTDELRQLPGDTIVQTGQTGGATSLFMRGGPSDGNKVLLDGIPVEDIGGVFDYGTVSSTAVDNIEIYRGPNSALFGSNSQASVVSVATPRGSTLRPLFTYSGDAGNLHTWRNETTLSGTHQRLDYWLGYSHLDASNALVFDRYHASTTAANVGYVLPLDISLRFTIRDGVSAEGLTDPHDFFGVSQDGKQGDQDLYSGATLENTTKGWHNLVRYGIVRKNEQAEAFAQPGTLGTVNDPSTGPFPGYFGNVVTIRGANGYSATGAAQMYESSAYQQTNNRDELYWQTDYVLPKNIAVLFGFRYENERGHFNVPSYSEFENTQRTNFEYNAQVQGDIKSRFFYSLGGSVQKNHLFGIAGTPRFGLAYVPVRPGAGWFHGTKLRVNLATGVQEPSVADEFYSLYAQLERYGDQADIALLHIKPLGPERSRTLDIGIDQNISRGLVLKAGYFHNQFSHQIEDVYSSDLATYFGISPVHLNPSSPFYDAEYGSMAYRAQGIETEVQWHPLARLVIHGGYTYLDAVIERSFSGDETALLQGAPAENPNIRNVPIGALSPLVGARPFRRSPHTGFIGVNYNRPRWTLALKGSMASRSDDSTFLLNQDNTDGNSLLLPNRNLDFGYVKLDLSGTYNLPHHLTLFSQMDNLLNDQHIGPIGYPGLPFTVRAGLKWKLGGE